nr:hypothetical protein [Tanacetum cinerariifolium]
MSTPKFVDVHNLVAFLSNPTESEGFDKIIDFLNANPIKYALTMNPTIYTSCIEQFLVTTKAKNINGEAHIHAKVDGKKVIISKATIRRDFKFEDEGGIDCLSNKVIFEQLSLMGMAKHLDSGTKFLMYPRFVQVFLDKQGWKGFFWQGNAFIPIMLVPAQEEELGEGLIMPYAPQHTPIIQPSTSKPQKKQKPRKSKQKDTQETQPSNPTGEALNEENVPAQSNDPPLSRTAQAKEIASLKRKVNRLEKKKKSRTHGLKRLYKVGISAKVESSAKEQSWDEEDALKQGRNIADIDADAETILVNETVVDQGRINDEEMFDADVLNDDEVVVKEINVASIATVVTAATTNDISIDDITLAQALVEIKTSKPKERCIIMQEPNETPTTTTIPISLKVQDKGKDYELATRLQKEEQGELTSEENSRLFVELMDKRKNHFAKLRAKEKRRKHLTKAQKRNQMCVYLKNMAGFTHK